MNGASVIQIDRERLSTIFALESEIFGLNQRFSKSRLRYLLDSPNTAFFLALKSETPVGYGIALKNQLRNGKTKGRIYSLGVIKNHRSEGIGTLLLRRMEAWLISKGSAFITLETKATKAGAKRFFRRYGYDVSEFLPKYYETIDGLRMQKTRSTFLALRAGRELTSMRT